MGIKAWLAWLWARVRRAGGCPYLAASAVNDEAPSSFFSGRDASGLGEWGLGAAPAADIWHQAVVVWCVAPSHTGPFTHPLWLPTPVIREKPPKVPMGQPPFPFALLDGFEVCLSGSQGGVFWPVILPTHALSFRNRPCSRGLRVVEEPSALFPRAALS